MKITEKRRFKKTAVKKPKATLIRVAKSKRRHASDTGLPEAYIEEKMFRTFADVVPVMTWISDANARRIYSNKRWLEFAGRTMEEDLAKGIAQELHPSELQRCVDTYREAFSTHQKFQMEYRWKRSDGQYRWLLEQGAPWTTPEGTFAGFVVSSIDVTDLSQQQETLKAEHDKLRCLMEERTASLLVTNARLQQEIAEHKRTERQLIEQQAQLRTLAAEVSMVEERERRRIAIRLHDDIGQALALLKLKVSELLESDPYGRTGQQLVDIRDLVDQTAQAARSAMFELSSPILYELGLEAAIQNLGEQHIKQQQGATFRFNTDHQVMTKVNSTCIAIFRIVRELLCNIRKHAGVCDTTVSISRVGECLHLIVEDSGKGFEVQKNGTGYIASKRFGLFSIREQVNGIGGSFEVESCKGTGTRVVVSVPIE